MTALAPKQMRALADQVDGYSWGDDPEVATALRAAADELDRLRALPHKVTVGATEVIRHVNAENDRLRAVIENAPHDRDESCGFGVDPRDMSNCTCWKADVL